MGKGGGLSIMEFTIHVWGYHPRQWDPWVWLKQAVATDLSAYDRHWSDRAVVLLGHQAAWPSWGVSWLYRALATHSWPAILIADLGQFPPDAWQAWNSLRIMMAYRTEAELAVPFRQWRIYAQALRVHPLSLTANQWTVVPAANGEERMTDPSGDYPPWSEYR